jgi:hypothetical protein
MDTLTITGSEQMVPAHAAVMTLARPSLLTALTKIAGTGYNIFEGFQYCLLIIFPSIFQNRVSGPA